MTTKKSIQLLYKNIQIYLKWSWVVFILSNGAIVFILFWVISAALEDTAKEWKESFEKRLDYIEGMLKEPEEPYGFSVATYKIGLKGNILEATPDYLVGFNIQTSRLFQKIRMLQEGQVHVMFYPDYLGGSQRIYFVRHMGKHFLASTFRPEEFFPGMPGNRIELVLISGGVVVYSTAPRQLGDIVKPSFIEFHTSRISISTQSILEKAGDLTFVATQNVTREFYAVLCAILFFMFVFWRVTSRARGVGQGLSSLCDENRHLTSLVRSLSHLPPFKERTVVSQLGNMVSTFEGSLGLTADKDIRFSENRQYLTLLEEFIKEILKLLEKAKSDAETLRKSEERYREEAEINLATAELSRNLLSPASIDDIAFLVLEQAKRLTGSRFGYVGHIDMERGYLVCPTLTRDIWETCQVADKDIIFKEFNGLWGWVLKNRKPLLTNAPADDSRCSGTPPGHVPIHRFMSAPALIDGKLIGQISIANADHDYTERELEVIERLANLYAIALQRQQAEKELEKHREHLEELVRERTAELEIARNKAQQYLDIAGVILVAIDAERRVTLINQKGCEILGGTAGEIVGKDWIETFVPPNIRQDVTKTFHQLMAGEIEPVEYVENPVLTQDGQERLIAWHNALLWDGEGNIVGTLSSGEDITEQKYAESEIRRLNQNLHDRAVTLEATNKELEGFVYSVSHDLRAPLRHIDGFMDLLQKSTTTALDDRSRHYMDTIVDSVKRMGTLIDDLLSFSRMGRHAVSFQKVALEELMSDIIREFEPDTAGRNIDWRIGDLPVVRGDKAMLRVVLVNLISNALKFTRPRQQAKIEIGSQSSQNSEAEIFVRDNGVGFDMAYADKLFGVFQRLHRTDEFEGTGIGLANVHRIIARHGGRTWAEGKVNQGATIYFSLPNE